MAPVEKKIVPTPKPTVKNSKYRVAKRPTRGFHRFKNGMLNVTPKGGERALEGFIYYVNRASSLTHYKGQAKPELSPPALAYRASATDLGVRTLL